jgi:hypothetical protein
MTTVGSTPGTGRTPTPPVALTTNLPPPAILPIRYNIENRLSTEQQSITGPVVSTASVSGWIVGENCNLERSTVYSKYTPASLEVTVTDAGTAWLYSDDYVDPITPGATYRAFAWVRTNALRRAVRIGIEWFTRNNTSQWDATTQSTVTTVGSADGWKLVSFVGAAPDTASFSTAKARVRILLPDAGDISDPPETHQQIWVDDVVFVERSRYLSPFTRMTYRWLPEYMRLMDAEQDNPDRPIGRFLDLMGVTASRILSAMVAFDYVPMGEDPPGFARSTLVDPHFYPRVDIAEERWLRWLAFITGTTVLGSASLVSGLRTPWYAIEDLSPPTTTWNDIEAFGSAPPTWDELEDYLPTPQNSVVPLQEAIRLRGTGTLAGTMTGIKRAARLVLTSDDAMDLPAVVTRLDNVVTATFEDTTALQAGDVIDVYDSGVLDLDGETTVVSVANDGRTITFASTGANLPLARRAWITNKYVAVIPRQWTFRATIVGSNSPTPHLRVSPSDSTMPVYEPWTDGATVTISASTNFAGSYVLGDDATATLDGADMLLDFASSVAAATDLQALVVVSPAKPVYVTIETLESQTPDPDLVLGAIRYSRPVGCWVTHRYAT